MKAIRSQNVANRIDARQSLEMCLAWEFHEEFSKGPLHDHIEDCIWAAVCSMDDFRNQNAACKAIVDKVYRNALKEQTAIFTKALRKDGTGGAYDWVQNFADAGKKWGSGLHILLRCSNWDAFFHEMRVYEPDPVEECSIARLFGEFIEDAAKMDPKFMGRFGYMYDHAKRKLGLRKGFIHKDKDDGVVLAKIREDRGAEFADEDNILKRMRDGKQAIPFPIPQSAVAGFMTSMGGGISLFNLKKQDTIAKIDSVFGLPLGASISGTTTDLMFTLQGLGACGKPSRLPDPLLYLLAIAGIVAPAHHTIIESMIPISLNPETHIDYVVGNYETLIPPMGGTQFEAQAKTLRTICAHYTDLDRRAGHAFMAFDRGQGKVPGAILFDKPIDKTYYEQCARVTENWVQVFHGSPQPASNMNVNEVKRLVKFLARDAPFPEQIN